MEDELEGYNVDNSCVHKFVFCECTGICNHYCNKNSKEGKEILSDYEADVRKAINSVKDTYKNKYIQELKDDLKIRDEFIFNRVITKEPKKEYKKMVLVSDSSDNNGGKF